MVKHPWLPVALMGLSVGCVALHAHEAGSKLLYSTSKTVEERSDGSIVITWRGVDQDRGAPLDPDAASKETLRVYLRQHPGELPDTQTTLARMADGSVVTTTTRRVVPVASK
jgi:hypothetical protein